MRGLPKGALGEIQLADAINIQAKKGLVEIVQLNGTRFDCGSVDGYVQALVHKIKNDYKCYHDG